MKLCGVPMSQNIYKMRSNEKNIKMITAEEARKKVEEHNSCATLKLDSEDKDVNTQEIVRLANEVIKQVSSDGLSKVTTILSSKKSIKEILDFSEIWFAFMLYGYSIKFEDETIGKAEGIVGEHIMSLKIEW